ncbi:MAG: ABC transporter substrate-binding protein, partial [Bacillota bacterium]
MFSKKGLLLTVMVFVMAASLLLGSAELMAEDDVTTITVAAFPDQDSGFEAILDDFHEEHPHIKVELEIADFDDHHQSLLTRIAAGSNVPDVANVEIAFVGDFVNRGGFENLTADPYNADRFKEDIIDYKWAQGTNDETGNLIAMPLDISPGTMFYRRDRLEELGADIDDLETMEDWIELGEEFAATTDEDNRWLFADAASVYEMIRRSGEFRFFNDEGEPIIT